jgi:hypothetical protein
MDKGDLPVSFGGSLRPRVSRQFSHKGVKHITAITATQLLKLFGKGLGSASPGVFYAWCAGIQAARCSSLEVIAP